MKYAMLILALVGFVSFAPARAQTDTRTPNGNGTGTGENFRRDRGDNRDGRDRRDFRRDRNGNQDSGRFDRTRERGSDQQRSFERSRENVTTTTTAVVPVAPTTTATRPAAVVAKAEAEIEPAPMEMVSTNSGPVDPTSYEAFRIIALRNIFDPNRFPGSTIRPNTTPPPPPKKTELFTLVGSISYDKGDFAFFDGSSSEYRKTVKAGDTIAGYKIAQVGPDKVTLEGNGKTVELPVGAQMKRRGDEEWQVNSHAEAIVSSGASADGSSSSTSSGSSSGGDMPDALKRLLEAKKNEK
jgi:hypothetical protein